MDQACLEQEYWQLQQKQAVSKLKKIQCSDDPEIDDELKCIEIRLRVVGFGLYYQRQPEIG